MTLQDLLSKLADGTMSTLVELVEIRDGHISARRSDFHVYLDTDRNVFELVYCEETT